jgi:hypothetical protein
MGLRDKGRMLLTMAALWLVAIDELAAQAPAVRIPSRPTCASCQIDFTPTVRVGDRDGRGVVENDRSWLRRDPQGRYFLGYAYATELKVFAPDGQFLHPLGRRGAGPGEFEGVVGVHFSRGDTVQVIDWGTSRRSMFTRDLRFVRSHPLAVQPQLRWSVLPDNRILVGSASGTAARAGGGLQLLNADGTRAANRALESALLPATGSPSSLRVFAPYRGDSIWVGDAESYAISLLDTRALRTVRRWQGNPAWFATATTDPKVLGAPTPRVASMHTAADGLLWVLIMVPDARWRTVVRAAGEGHFEVLDYDKYTDAIIEVIRPSTGELVHSQRFDRTPPWFIGDGEAARFEGEDVDDPHFRVYRVTLRGR